MEEAEGEVSTNSIKKSTVGQEQIQGLLFSEKLSWQAIIYDLINTEQLDPWNIDLCLLANRFLERVRSLEEANFFVTSKVLLAASLLLRIKSEILLNQYIPSLDDILFGKEEEKKYVQQQIEFDEDVPDLVPRTPLPRVRKVSLQELMSALGKAIKTENRRIRRVIIDKQRLMETGVVLPKRSINIKAQINSLYNKLKSLFSNGDERIAFSSFSGESIEDKLANFVPLLHLDYQHKVIAEQDNAFEEIWVWLKEVYHEKHSESLEQMRKESEEAMKLDLIQLAKEGELEKLEKKKKGKKGNFKKKEDFQEVSEMEDDLEHKGPNMEREVDEE
ncbi:MAG: segregation/condensation protein A [Nanoarchaeota archaeon]|nr:segregation/condensation protein A [Nanoarchaeota archaeon]